MFIILCKANKGFHVDALIDFTSVGITCYRFHLLIEVTLIVGNSASAFSTNYKLGSGLHVGVTEDHLASFDALTIHNTDPHRGCWAFEDGCNWKADKQPSVLLRHYHRNAVDSTHFAEE